MHVHVERLGQYSGIPVGAKSPDRLLLVPERVRIWTEKSCERCQAEAPWFVELVASRNEGDHEIFEIDELTISRRRGGRGEPINHATLRDLSLSTLLTDGLRAVTLQGTLLAVNVDGTLDVKWDQTPSVAAEVDIRPIVRRGGGGRRRNEVDPAVCREALELYEQAKERRTPGPLNWVARELGVSRSTAHNYVKQAQMERGES